MYRSINESIPSSLLLLRGGLLWGGEARGLLLRPVAESLLVGVGELGRRVQGQVEPERHLAVLDLLADSLQPVRSLPLAVGAPLGEVEFPPALVHVARQEPGDRRDRSE